MGANVAKGMLALGIVSAALLQPVSAQAQARIFYDDREITFGSERPFGRFGTVYVPAREVADRIGARIDRGRDRWLFSWQNVRLDYTIGERGYGLNGRRQPLPGPSVEQRGNVYVPIELFEGLTGGRVNTFARRTDDWRDRDQGRGPGWSQFEEVYWDGRRVDFPREERPYMSGRTIMVPARTTTSKIGGRFERNGSGDRIRIEYNRDVAEYRKGDTSFRLNGRDIRLDGRSEEYREVFYLPARVFEELTRGRFSTRSNNNVIGRPGDWDRPGGIGEVYLDSRRIDFSGNERPFRAGSTLLVPARAMTSRIGARFERTADGKRIWIESGRNRVTYNVGADWFRLDNRDIRLPTRSQERNTILFIPIEIFEEITRGRVSWR